MRSLALLIAKSPGVLQRPRSTIPRPPAKSKPPLPVAMLFPGQAFIIYIITISSFYVIITITDLLYVCNVAEKPRGCFMQGSQYPGMLKSCLDIPAVEKMSLPQQSFRLACVAARAVNLKPSARAHSETEMCTACPRRGTLQSS